MATLKTYKSNSRSLTLFIAVRGRVRRVSFTDMGANYGYSILTTDDPKLQSALEHDRRYGKAFKLFKEDKPSETAEAQNPVEEKKPVDASYPKVTRTQGALKIMEEKYGIDVSALSSKTDVLRVANQLNIEFPNLK